MKEKAAALIVRFRYFMMALFLVLAVIAATTISKVRVNYDLTSYLREDTDTMKGLSVMNGEFSAVSSLSVVLLDCSEETARAYAAQFSGFDGMMSCTHDPAAGMREQEGHVYRLLSLIMTEESAAGILDSVESALIDMPHLISGGAKDSRDLQQSIANEIPVVMAVACAIVFCVLLLMTRSYLEPLLFFLVIAVSILLNMGTNWIFPSISFITFAVAAILQLALAMDYSIILLNAFDRLRRQGLSLPVAMTQALASSFMPVASSALTTVAGMLALVFMSFTIGFDIGVVLAKGIVLSMVTVFLFMPGLLMLFAPLLDKTAHKPFLPLRGEGILHMTQTARHALPLLLIVLILVGACLQGNNVYTYTVRDMSSDAQTVTELFGQSNQLVLLFPADDTDDGYARQRAMLEEISGVSAGGRPVVQNVLSMVTTGEAAIAYYDAAGAAALLGRNEEAVSALFRQLDITAPIRGDALVARLSAAFRRISFLLPQDTLAQLTQAQTLLETAKSTFNGAHYSRALLTLDLPFTSPYAHEVISRFKEILHAHYGEDGAMAGMLLAMDDIATSFSGDMTRVTLITAALVFLIVCLSFRSLLVPALLVCIIQGAVYVNMSLSCMLDGSIFFMCYLICIALQMGATIDYGILLTSHYCAQRTLLPPKEALSQAIQLSLQTILTSGLALIIAGFTVGAVSSVFYISSIGVMLARGAMISVVLILFLLPQLLLWLDRWLVKPVSARQIAV